MQGPALLGGCIPHTFKHARDAAYPPSIASEVVVTKSLDELRNTIATPNTFKGPVQKCWSAGSMAPACHKDERRICMREVFCMFPR
eukprot:CAMPEP_0194773494 /NCGR_PEP_ID=MMETSP0323_2-20130528/55012_1 /TAXON_ID=2866 ORGANISM="Crypthecodinium cohnii, Strain Seligo" /NCGR_SAMPLE_ID=MMETSP0323_2 /ASSEMBLY_ACC=CAM_ASM_000346 /LENGTH=85 /DNA_ID=CAMNT_0039708583 /DNA_START=305 /DNA_END=558 /DNA_ORIENTATION=+